MRSFGELAPHEQRNITFTLTNIGSRKVTLVGARSSCACAIVADLPMSLEAAGSRSVKVTVRGVPNPGDVRETVEFFTDYPGQARLLVQIRGRIVK